MKCVECGKIKLRREFPGQLLSEQCTNHPPSCCLRCVKKKVPLTKKCPYPGCGAPIVVDGPEMGWCDLRLNLLFPDVDSSAVEEASSGASPAAPSGIVSRVNVTVLNGDTKAFFISPQKTVLELKRDIKDQWPQYEINKQKLIFNGIELEVENDAHKVMKLGDYNIPNNATIHLLVLLMAIPEKLNHVTFDLFWGFPARGCDYLDATCLGYSNTVLKGVIDYRQSSSFGNSIWHSGDVMDHQKRIGHHTIQVRLKEVPANITHLVFTLSAWNSPTIAHYPNPSLQFFDAQDVSKTPLCKTSFSHARNSQAVVMCSVSRKEGIWRIFESGALSAGNAKRYDPLQATIENLIRTNRA